MGVSDEWVAFAKGQSVAQKPKGHGPETEIGVVLDENVGGVFSPD